MLDPIDLTGLLNSYIQGDVLARKVLLDLLAEEGDPRHDRVRDESINWDRIAGELASDWGNYQRHDQPRIRWWIDCVRFGNTAPDFVTDRVRLERRRWLANLFPECPLIE